jgi:hypothetical protein
MKKSFLIEKGSFCQAVMFKTSPRRLAGKSGKLKMLQGKSLFPDFTASQRNFFGISTGIDRSRLAG